jgi:hypothetical protein
MDEHQRLIEQVEHLLVRAEAMQQEFRMISETLRQHLARLRQEQVARTNSPLPARPVAPAPSSAPPPLPVQQPASSPGILSKLTKRIRRANLTPTPTPTPTAETAPVPLPTPAGIETPSPNQRATPTTGDHGERRASPRRKGNPVSVLVTTMTDIGPPIESWVVDRSQGGVCLLVDEAVEIGAQLRILPAKARAGIRWVEVEVTSCRQERNSWKIGCKFLQKLSWAEMQLFG